MGVIMKKFIFLTKEGFTFQPSSDSSEPDIENEQMIGISSGESSHEALKKLIKENQWLNESKFDEIYALELAENENQYFFSVKSELNQY